MAKDGVLRLERGDQVADGNCKRKASSFWLGSSTEPSRGCSSGVARASALISGSGCFKALIKGFW